MAQIWHNILHITSYSMEQFRESLVKVIGLVDAAKEKTDQDAEFPSFSVVMPRGEWPRRNAKCEMGEIHSEDSSHT